MLNAMFTLAQAAPKAPPAGGGLNMMVMMALIFGIMYFMMIRPQQRKEKERRSMIDELKSGTRVMFGGGILGTVTNVKDTTFIVKIADGVKIEIAKGAVTRVYEKGEKPGSDEK